MTFRWDSNKSLGEVLAKQLTVPNHQRDYAWGSDEASDFISDLILFTKTRGTDEDYLFGQLIFYEKDGVTSIIDGQQRIVTSIILMSIVREKLEHDRFKKIRTDNYEDYSLLIGNIVKAIGNKSRGDFHFSIKGNAKPYFERHILKGEPISTSGRYTATKIIKTVYDVIKTNLNYIDDLGDQEAFDELDKIITCFLDGFRVSLVTTDDLSQAYTIFETLNSRGKDLEAADLLKNFCIMKAGESIAEEWSIIESGLDEAKESITKYIRYAWNSKYGLVSKRAIYRVISRDLKTKRDVDSFVEDLSNLYPYYLSLTNPQNYDEFKDNAIKEKLIGLSTLGARIFYPIVLSFIRIKTDNKTILKVIKSIESLTVRNIVIGSHNANEYESSFCDVAKEISNQNVTIDEAINMITSKIDSDDLFISHFKTATIADSKTARYILTEIYNLENGKESQINRDSSEVNREHIMPEKADKWNVRKDIHEQYLNYIGNQTLLLSKDNTSVSNEIYGVKKEIYLKSSLKQNNEYFKNIDEWTPDEIEKRQELLSRTAVMRWPNTL